VDVVQRKRELNELLQELLLGERTVMPGGEARGEITALAVLHYDAEVLVIQRLKNFDPRIRL